MSVHSNISTQAQPAKNAPVGVTRNRAGTARQINGGIKQMPKTMTAVHTTVGPKTSVVHTSKAEQIQRFQAVILPYNAKQLSKGSGRSPEAAVHWRAGTRLPDFTSMTNLARSYDRVRAFVLDELTPEQKPDSMATKVVAALHKLTFEPGQDGAMARALLHSLTELTRIQD